MPRHSSYYIRRPAQLDAVATPLRQQMVTVMEHLQVFSVSELAARLGRSPQSLYYHVEQLVDAGLVVAAGERPSRRRNERLFKLVARRIRIDPEDRRPAYVAAIKRSARAVFRLAERLFMTTYADPRCAVSGTKANMRLQQLSARLSRRNVRELVRRLTELDEFILDNDDPEEPVTFTVTTAFSPVLKQ